MKGHNIECIAYNSPERINFMKDFFLKCNKMEKLTRKAMKGYNIECIAYYSPERINFMKDFILKMQ